MGDPTPRHDFAVLIESPKISFEFTPKKCTATVAIPRVTTMAAITPRMTSSATSRQPHGTRKSSESSARNGGSESGAALARGPQEQTAAFFPRGRAL